VTLRGLKRQHGKLPSFPLIQGYNVNQITLSLSYSTSVIAYLKFFNFTLLSYSCSSFIGFYPEINSSIMMLRRTLYIYLTSLSTLFI